MKNVYIITCTQGEIESIHHGDVKVPRVYYKLVCAYQDKQLVGFLGPNSRTSGTDKENQRKETVLEKRDARKMLEEIGETFDAIESYADEEVFGDISKQCREYPEYDGVFWKDLEMLNQELEDQERSQEMFVEWGV